MHRAREEEYARLEAEARRAAEEDTVVRYTHTHTHTHTLAYIIYRRAAEEQRSFRHRLCIFCGARVACAHLKAAD